jgi:hypothetical protein
MTKRGSRRTARKTGAPMNQGATKAAARAARTQLSQAQNRPFGP